MVPNGPNVPNWSQLIPNGPKWSQMVPNGYQMVPNDLKWSQLVKKIPKDPNYHCGMFCSEYFLDWLPLGKETMLAPLRSTQLWQMHHIKKSNKQKQTEEEINMRSAFYVYTAANTKFQLP